MSADKILIGNAVKNVEESPQYAPISNVRIHVGEDSQGNPLIYSAENGTNSGYILDIKNPWGTQQMADDIFAAVKGYAYKPYEATGAILNPVAEIGDGVNVGEVYSVIAETETTFSPIMSATIGASGGNDIDHEYPYEDSTDQAITQQLARMRTSFIVEQGRIAGEVRNLSTNMSGLYNRVAAVEITADGITSTVAAAQNKYYIPNNITVDFYGYGSPDADKYPPAKNFGKIYLDQNTGQCWKSNGSTWEMYGPPLQLISVALSSEIALTAGAITQTVSETYITKEDSADAISAAIGTATNAITQSYTSKIEQTARSITSTVAVSIDKYDLSKIPTGSTIIQDFGAVDPEIYPASKNKKKYYVNLLTGEYWRSTVVDGNYTWVSQGTLDSINQSYGTRITQTENDILAEVTDRETAISGVRSELELTASAIRAEVLGSYADEWSVGGYNGTGAYHTGDYVKITAYDASDQVIAMDFYQCINDDLAPSVQYTKPGVGTWWEAYWVKTTAPSIQSTISVDLKGITLSYKSTAMANSAYITLNKDGVEIGGGTIVMSNVMADTIAANTWIQTPVIYDERQFGKLRFKAISGSGVMMYGLGSDADTKRTAAFAVSYDPVSGPSELWMSGARVIRVNPDSPTDVYMSESNQYVWCWGTWDFRNANVLLPS